MSDIQQTDDRPTYEQLKAENERIGTEYQKLLQQASALNMIIRRIIQNIKIMDLDIENGLMPNKLTPAEPPRQPQQNTTTPPNTSAPTPNQQQELQNQPNQLAS
jgi:hypothetical protein